MADKVYTEAATGIKRRLRDVGNGFYADEVAISTSLGDPSNNLSVQSITNNWRADFTLSPLDPAKWTDRSVTPGNSTATVTGGNLVIAAGVGTNQERIIESVPVFSVGMLARFALLISQRIVNQEIRIEIVSVTDNGDGTYTTDEDSRASWLFDGTVVTTAKYEVGVGLTTTGATQSASGTITTTAATSIFEITHTNDETVFSQRPIDSTAVRAAQFVKTQNIPSPSKLYRLRIRVKNLAVAPASNTNVTLAFVSCTDYNELMAEITGGRGDAQPGAGIPVNIASPTPMPISVGASAWSAAGVNIPSTSVATTTAPSIGKINSAATTNATSQKATIGRVMTYEFANTGATWAYVKFYNKATAPTVGTDIPLFVVAVPPGGRSEFFSPYAKAFSTGIGYAITGGAADTDTTAVAAGQVVGHFEYA